LSPDRDDPIFIGINRLVAKGLKQNENNDNPIPYPCHVANRFECPYDYEKGKRPDTKFGVDDLYDLASMAFAVEVALAVARKDASAVQIRNKQDLYQALTNREAFDMILKQGLDCILSDKETFDDTSRFELLQKDNRDKIVDHFMNIKDKIKLEELRFY
jgi:hypothetical protein